MKIDSRQVITLDFETYWAHDFSLSSKTLNTSEYIRSPQFLAHCCAIKVGWPTPSATTRPCST